MPYFYLQACEIKQVANETLANQLKDNFHRHPKSGYIHDLITDLPQKTFADVMAALNRLANDFEQRMGKNDSPVKREQWMQQLLAEVDHHNSEFGLDPQQTGNLIRYTLRGMIYHHYIENTEYLMPKREVDPLPYLNSTTFQHPLFREKTQNKHLKQKSLALVSLFNQLTAAYRKGLLACGLLLDDQQIDCLATDLKRFKSRPQKGKSTDSEAVHSTAWLKTFNTIKQLTLFSDVYWNIGALFGLRAFLIRLDASYQILAEHPSEQPNPLATLITDKVNNEEHLAVVFNATQQILTVLQNALEHLTQQLTQQIKEQ